ncbi:MAG: hypothetical protein ACKVWV_06410 [Planctomycetota bacterium]
MHDLGQGVVVPGTNIRANDIQKFSSAATDLREKSNLSSHVRAVRFERARAIENPRLSATAEAVHKEVDDFGSLPAIHGILLAGIYTGIQTDEQDLRFIEPAVPRLRDLERVSAMSCLARHDRCAWMALGSRSGACGDVRTASDLEEQGRCVRSHAPAQYPAACPSLRDSDAP